jgi:hypothetical protein
MFYGTAAKGKFAAGHRLGIIVHQSVLKRACTDSRIPLLVIKAVWFGNYLLDPRGGNVTPLPASLPEPDILMIWRGFFPTPPPPPHPNPAS